MFLLDYDWPCIIDANLLHRKKYKVSLQCNEGKIIFYPMQKGVKAQTAAAMEAFTTPFFTFCAKVKPRVFDYSKFPLGDVERDESMKIAMAKGKVFASCSGSDGGDNRIIFFGLSEEDLDEAVDIFQTECMPLKNTVLASYAVEGKAFRVTVIHGDFQKQRADALLSEMNEMGVSKIPPQFLIPKKTMDVSRALIQRLVASKRTLFESGTSNEKVQCKWYVFHIHLSSSYSTVHKHLCHDRYEMYRNLTLQVSYLVTPQFLGYQNRTHHCIRTRLIVD